MGTRTFAQVPPTAATIALNAYIFGYAGHSLVTPHAALKQLWWTDDRIDAKVTRHFVVSRIRGEERDFLNKQLAFGEGLTDHTYMEWILERARRLFLILSVVGRAEHIFSLIDDSLDDDDLPFSLENVISLELSIDPDDLLSRKFYDLQFQYLLRQLKEGLHIDYGVNEHIPMEHVHKLPPAMSLQCWDRVHFPSLPDTVYLRRKFPFGTNEMQDKQRAQFLQDIAKANSYRHEHVLPVWASYTTDEAGFTLSNFVPEHTLSSFIAHREPYQWMRVSAIERPVVLLEWMHCLADALASLHHRGTLHGAIRPSNILIDYDNRIAFAEIGATQLYNRGNKNDKTEMLNYAAPETQQCRAPRMRSPDGAMASPLFFRRQSSSSISSSSPSYFNAATTQHSTSPTDTPQIPLSPTFRNFSRHLSGQQSRPTPPGASSPSTPGFSAPSSSTNKAPPSPPPASRAPSSPSLTTKASPSLSPASPYTTHPSVTDIFALGATFLDLLTFLLKGKLNELTKFRNSASTKVSKPRRSKNNSDTSNSNNTADKSLFWIQHLQAEYLRLPPAHHPALEALPNLLDLTAKMLHPSPSHRPSAREVRDRIETILEQDGEIESLCCRGREWEGGDENEDAKIGSRRRVRDSVSTGQGTASTEGSGGLGLVGLQQQGQQGQQGQQQQQQQVRRSGETESKRRKLSLLLWRRRSGGI